MATTAEEWKKQYTEAGTTPASPSTATAGERTRQKYTGAETTAPSPGPTSGYQSGTTGDNGLSIYDNTYLNQADKASVQQYKQLYQQAKDAGDTAGMDAAHNSADEIRNKYLYSGGAAGDQYISLAPSGVDKSTMTSSDQAKIAQLKAQYAQANKAGDTAGMQSAHDAAEAIRAAYGYTGGADGSGYNRLSPEDYANAQAPTYQAQTIPEAQDYSEYLKNLYSSNLEAALAGYEGAYNNSVAELNRAAESIPGQYQAARNEAAASYETGLRNYAEYAAANGLNSGAAAQARLSSMNQYQGNLNDIATQEGDAMADLELQRTQLANSYQTQIAQAKAENNAQLAQALYNEYIRLDDAAIDRAMNQSSLDYNTWQSVYQAYADNKDSQTEATQTLASYGWQLLNSGIMPTTEQLAAMNLDETTATTYINKLWEEQLREAGETALSNGVMPTEEQLAAMGVTSAQALQILYNAGYGTYSGSGGSSRGGSKSSSSGSGSGTSDSPRLLLGGGSGSSEQTGYLVNPLTATNTSSGVQRKTTSSSGIQSSSGKSVSTTTSSVKNSSGASALKSSSTTLKKK